MAGPPCTRSVLCSTAITDCPAQSKRPGVSRCQDVARALAALARSGRIGVVGQSAGRTFIGQETLQVGREDRAGNRCVCKAPERLELRETPMRHVAPTAAALTLILAS